MSVPSAPTITSHQDNQTLQYNDDVASTTQGMQITLVGSGDASDIVSITYSSSTTASSTATTTASSLGAWSKQLTLSEGANTITLQSQEADGDVSSSTTIIILNLNTAPSAITDLAVSSASTTATSTALVWTTPNQANLNIAGSSAYYDVRYTSGADCALTESNFASSTPATGEPMPALASSTAATLDITGLTPNTAYCFGLKTFNGSRLSSLSNIATTTLPGTGVDAEQTQSNATQQWGRNYSNQSPPYYSGIAQSFAPTASSIKGVSVEMCRAYTVTNETITLTIKTGAAFGAGTTTASWLYNVANEAQRAVINNMVPLCSAGFQFVTLGIGTSYTFGNDTPQPLTPGAAYHFRITSGNGNVYRTRYQSSGNVYNNGEMARQERAPNWETLPDADLSFKTLY